MTPSYNHLRFSEISYCKACILIIIVRFKITYNNRNNVYESHKNLCKINHPQYYNFSKKNQQTLTGKTAAAHSPGAALSASTDANMASILACTALLTLRWSSSPAQQPSSTSLIEVQAPAKLELHTDLESSNSASIRALLRNEHSLAAGSRKPSQHDIVMDGQVVYYILDSSADAVGGLDSMCRTVR